ncbi:MAG TPA: carbamoyltransferase C-terminal domain-containing protein [Candidatus Hydrogenedentes bacterium]|nr:carbamoyltransferase C-terminal domain-containing protein [Candidatus Hydrogenedentota bacterium]HRT63302.1 carbamoyltransferase C-terminal domain-containing protein [Candidatus Hydrogenedentota bacterium]
MIVLGIWDGHDSGAALLENGRVRIAVNEERLTRRKLEIRFPALAIRCCLDFGGWRPEDVDLVAYSTGDLSKTLARWAPFTKETYYQIRRRKLAPSHLHRTEKRWKYWLTTLPGNRVSEMLSDAAMRRRLVELGITSRRIVLVDHHQAHAATAAYLSGFDSASVVTLDGVGDGLSATVSVYSGGRLERLEETPASDSLGVFFEHVTNLLNMRELEDEGKVMALATYAYPIPDEQNPLISLFEVNGLRLRARYGPLRLYDELKRILWYYPSEQFARMAQRSLEIHVMALARNAVRKTGFGNLALAGGVASNIKVNMLLRECPDIADVFVFPHMGDGGLAVGAALQAAKEAGENVDAPLEDVFWGPETSDPTEPPAGIARMAQCEGQEAVVRLAAELIARGEILLWYDGRMEYGPRALGHRSILARADAPDVRDRLNLQLKKRVWYQPFCPSILDREAQRLLENTKGRPNRFMTMGYRARTECRSSLQAVLGVDGSCRPQFVREDGSSFARLLALIQEHTGTGCVLNTSMNLHGEPLAASLDHVFRLMRECGFRYLACPGTGSFYTLDA